MCTHYLIEIFNLDLVHEHELLFAYVLEPQGEQDLILTEIFLLFQSLFFVELYPSETQKLAERLVNYVIYKVFPRTRAHLWN